MTTALPPRPVPPHRFLLSRLQRDWERLGASRAALRTARSWPLSVERFESLDELLRRLGYGQPAPAGAHDDDDVLRELLLIARTDELAARVVLQRILPGLSSVTRRRARSFHEELVEFDDVLTMAWTVIRCFPVERRPDYIAANLIRDVDYHVFRRPYRRMAQIIPMPSEHFDQRVGDTDVVDEDDPRQQLADLLRLAERAGVDPADLELARRLGSGTSTAELAAERNVTDRTIRNHRAAMVRNLQAVAAAAAATADAAA